MFFWHKNLIRQPSVAKTMPFYCKWSIYFIFSPLRSAWIFWQIKNNWLVPIWFWLCWGLTSQSTIFQSYRDGAIASWVINQYFRGVKCLAQGHNTAAVGLEPRTSRFGVRHSTTEPRCLFEIRKIAVCLLWLSLMGHYRVTDETLLAETT